MSTNGNDYRRDLEDIRDRLNWVVELAETDEFEPIKERLDTIEEDQAELRESFNKVADTLNKLCDSYNKLADGTNKLCEAYNKFADRFPPTITKLVEELTKPCTPFSKAFDQAFGKSTTAPAPPTKAKRTKPHKPKLAVVPT
jgi:hypothetical protein